MNENLYNGFYLYNSSYAEKLRDEVLGIVRAYGQITVGAYYDLAGKYLSKWVSIQNHDEDELLERRRILTDYGWKNLKYIDIFEVDGHWKLRLPEPTNLFEDDEEELDMGNDISNPDYYKSEGIEVIDVIRAFTEDLTGVEAFATGNIIKYACRWKKKNGIADLKKILWYTQYLIDSLSERDDNVPEEEEFTANETLQSSFKIHGLIFENEKIANDVIHFGKVHIQTFGFLTLRDFITTVVLGRTKENVTVELHPGIDPDRYGWKYDTFSKSKVLQNFFTEEFTIQLPELEEDD